MIFYFSKLIFINYNFSKKEMKVNWATTSGHQAKLDSSSKIILYLFAVNLSELICLFKYIHLKKNITTYLWVI